MDKHEILCALKDLAINLGRVPNIKEFTEKVSVEKIKAHFGGFYQMLAAAGLSSIDYNKKVTDPLNKSVESLKTKAFNSKYPIFGPYEKTVCIGDIHSPFTCLQSMQMIYYIIEKEKPKNIVFMGDAYDFFAQSKFPKQIKITPEDEVKSAKTMLENIFKSVVQIAPQSKIYLLKGNHDIRPIKRLTESVPELSPFFDLEQFFRFDNVETILDARDPLILNGIAFHHGFMGSGQHCLKFGMPTVTGHLHRGGVSVKKVHAKWLWEMDAGYVGDPESVCFNYTPVRESKWTRGVGLISEWGPCFIPFE